MDLFRWGKQRSVNGNKISAAIRPNFEIYERSEIFVPKSPEILDPRIFNLCRTTTKPTQVENFGSFASLAIWTWKQKSLSRKVPESSPSKMSDPKSPSPQKGAANPNVGGIYMPSLAECSSSKMSVQSSERTTKIVEIYHGKRDGFESCVFVVVVVVCDAFFIACQPS